MSLPLKVLWWSLLFLKVVRYPSKVFSRKKKIHVSYMGIYFNKFIFNKKLATTSTEK